MTEQEKTIRHVHEQAYTLGYNVGMAHGRNMIEVGLTHLRALLNGAETDEIAKALAELEQLRAKPKDMDGALDKIAELQKQNQALLDQIKQYQDKYGELTESEITETPELLAGMVLPEGYYVLPYGEYARPGDLRLFISGKHTVFEVGDIAVQYKNNVETYGVIYARKKGQ